jgi:hypothetical protein
MKPRSNTRPISGTRSVLRAISVLKTLGRSGSAYGITELGTATGLSKATVFRLLGALESEGMVAREVSTGLYRLGPELIALGASALSTSDLRIVARDELIRIAEESARLRPSRFYPRERYSSSTKYRDDSFSERRPRSVAAGHRMLHRPERFFSR